jgi:hypothetical protein
VGVNKKPQKGEIWPELLQRTNKSDVKLPQQESRMFTKIVDLIKKLVDLAEERNTLALGSLSELRDIHALLVSMGAEQVKQTKLLEDIAAVLVGPPPGAATKLVLTLGQAVPQ